MKDEILRMVGNAGYSRNVLKTDDDTVELEFTWRSCAHDENESLSWDDCSDELHANILRIQKNLREHGLVGDLTDSSSEYGTATFNIRKRGNRES